MKDHGVAHGGEDAEQRQHDPQRYDAPQVLGGQLLADHVRRIRPVHRQVQYPKVIESVVEHLRQNTVGSLIHGSDHLGGANPKCACAKLEDIAFCCPLAKNRPRVSRWTCGDACRKGLVTKGYSMDIKTF